MAMLRVKRPLNLDGLDDALPAQCARGPHTAESPQDQAQAVKRQRFIMDAAHTAQQAGVPVGAGVRDSPFQAKPMSRTEVERLMTSSLGNTASPKKAEAGADLQHLFASVASSPAREHVSAATQEKAGGEKVYSKEDLHTILNKVVEQRESLLREEYNTILHSKLAEQFNSFTKFNQDYISRQIKGNPFSYVS
jgi:hypothetical protein